MSAFTITGDVHFAPGLSRRRRRQLEIGVLGAKPTLLERIGISLMSGYSRAAAAGGLSWSWGKAETLFKKPAKVFLALCTVVPTSSSTGTSITEATGATGYARKEVPVASIAEAVEGATSTIETNAELVFAAITAGSATVIAWALVDALTVGNIVMWGTATSTVISSTQTPPTIAAKALKGEVT